MRKHPCFSKLKIGSVLTDNLEEKFEVLEIDKIEKRARVKDLQDTKSRFWISWIYINKPHLLDLLGED